MKLDFLSIAALLGVLSVSIGAFGAHGLHDLLVRNNRIDTFETAVKYQFYHTLVMVIIGFVLRQYGFNSNLNWACIFFLVGIIIFSGSLYILCLTNIKWLGAITPIGGLAFILGWVYLFIYSIK